MSIKHIADLTYHTIWDLLKEHGTTTLEGFAKEAYDRTPCGVSVRFLDDDGDETQDPELVDNLIFGAIVEGEDAEYDADLLTFPFTDKELAEAWDYLEEMTDREEAAL